MKLDVAYVAELARIELTNEERTVFQRQLDDIVDWVDQLKQVDIEGVEPMTNGYPVVNAFREDEVCSSLDREQALENSPARVGNEFLLPKIVEGAES